MVNFKLETVFIRHSSTRPPKPWRRWIVNFSESARDFLPAEGALALRPEQVLQDGKFIPLDQEVFTAGAVGVDPGMLVRISEINIPVENQPINNLVLMKGKDRSSVPQHMRLAL